MLPYVRFWPILLFLCLPAGALERAAYDSNGRIIALLSESEDIEAVSNLVAVLPSGRRIPLQTRRDRRGLVRKGDSLLWTGAFELPDGGTGRMEMKSEEDDSGVRYSASVTAETELRVDAIELVIDLPRLVFLNGRVSPDDGEAVALAASRPASPVLYRGEPRVLRFRDAEGAIALDIAFERTCLSALIDRWDTAGRSFQLRAALQRGPLPQGKSAGLTAALQLKNSSAAQAVQITLDASRPRYRFDGFGGNYCWNTASPVSAYTLKNLKVAWGRTEMKLQQWDLERDNPGPAIRADMETMRRFHEMGVPYVISIWWLPERFYTDPYEKPRSTHFRKIDPEKWDELLELVGGYLDYAKREYSVEPDLFSFNEANIGVYVGQTPEEHAKVIKRFGVYFRKLGLKTKMLLGDATGPRDTHKFVLEAAADPDAMQYVGAVGFHSWGGATPEQYAAWGDVAEWLGLPLLVTELGVDAAAYNNRAYNSYHYGLREARLTQELLLHARPQGTQFWQFTNDYGLARQRPDGTVEPTARFWLMKHFTDLTPQKSEALAVSSDQPSVLCTAFRGGGRYVLHILNLGGARTASLDGLPEADWEATETIETGHFKARHAGSSAAGKLSLKLPARSLVTLTASVGAAASVTR
ncbi:MAG: hypothetical protein ACM3S5_14565 [Rhodospirillales bacterium]